MEKANQFLEVNGLSEHKGLGLTLVVPAKQLP